MKKKYFKQVVKKVLILCLLLVVISSCIPNEKVLYTQNKDADPALGLDTLIIPPRKEYYLQPRDILSINFFSNVDEAIEPFRQTTSDVVAGAQLGQQGNQGGQGVSLGQTFIIDNNGMLLINTLKPVKAIGYTTLELKEILEKEIREVKGIKDISLNVSLAGIRFTTMGEMGTGEQIISGSQANILQAIAASGDLTINADRQRINIIRSYEGGLKWHEIDITQRSLALSDYWFIKPGDIIYAPPLKLREIGAGDSFLSQLGTVITLIGAVIFFINLTGN
uniref:polysaccharide biosynthesis/export family protein n=3 Tax=Roseivirga sp. TaxID=1964215 RepID=UPI0040480C11